MTHTDYVRAIESLPLDRARAVEFAKGAEGRQLEAKFHPIITWCTELERLTRGNAANFLMAGTYSEIIYICALVPFGFYRSAYMSLRSVIDEFLAYSYYMTHPVELRTAFRREGFYLTREDFWSYHLRHSPGFGRLVTGSGVATEFTQIYSDLSKTIHAQVPDHVCTITSFSDIQFSVGAARGFLRMQDRTCKMLGVFALIVFRDFYRDFSTDAKRAVVKGMSSGLIRRIGVKP